MVQVLMIARTMGVLTLGNIALDGSKLKANASKHSALSYGHIKKLEEQLQGEVKKLMEVAEAADNAKMPDGLNLPEEIACREDRLKAIAAAKIKIEAPPRNGSNKNKPTTKPSLPNVKQKPNKAASLLAAKCLFHR